ncbi:MAG: hypothetical protein CL902_00805 [Dehalococcoidia bacterium]|nr:hypothetical protein [Dehalococcoidia bacterium]
MKKRRREPALVAYVRAVVAVVRIQRVFLRFLRSYICPLRAEESCEWYRQHAVTCAPDVSLPAHKQARLFSHFMKIRGCTFDRWPSGSEPDVVVRAAHVARRACGAGFTLAQFFGDADDKINVADSWIIAFACWHISARFNGFREDIPITDFTEGGAVCERLHQMRGLKREFEASLHDPECGDVMGKYRDMYEGMSDRDIVAHGIKNAVARHILVCIDYRMHIPTVLDTTLVIAPEICDAPSLVLCAEVFCTAITLGSDERHLVQEKDLVRALKGEFRDYILRIVRTLPASMLGWFKIANKISEA